MSFRTPVRDLAFSLTRVAGFAEVQAAFPECDDAIVQAVLHAAGDLADEPLARADAAGDAIGARLVDGRVVTAPGFREAYKAWAEAGWSGLASDPDHGGQGLPKSLMACVFEAASAANLSFSLCPVLSVGAAEAIAAHGTQRQKALVLPKLVSGEWTGAMDLTEPQAGSDLALVRTVAEPDGAGGYRLHGQKIFITWGDHDCAENVVHLVLARTPDAPRGVKGISLFLASKRLIDDDGTLGADNAVRVGGIEHKLGIHGSPTCTMLYEGAKAELVGPLHQGLACMFTMMNAARLLVAVQGVGVAERAFQRALAYARDRRQGRSPWSGEAPALIVDLPDVRRTLTLMKARTEAARAICLATAVAADVAKAAADPDVRRRASLREELLTPIAKAWVTDAGVEVASMGIQVHGGMGFIEETGAAQQYRDARILPIYEGTNGIQAMDLVGRKLPLENGEAWNALLAELREGAGRLTAAGLERVRARLVDGVVAMQAAAAWLSERRGSADALAGATPFLKLCGDVIGGWLLTKGAEAAAGETDTGFAAARLRLARVYAEQVLAGAPGLVAAVCGGAGDLEALDAGALGG